MPRLVLDIADFPIALVFPPCALAGTARTRYRAFVRDSRPRLTLQVALLPVGRRGRRPRPVVSELPDGRLLLLRRGDFRVEIDPRRGTGRGDLRDQIVSLDNLIRVLHATLLVRRRGLLAHAAALITRSGAWVFPGRSGSGKSTVSRLAGRRRALTDELAAVRRQGRRWLAMGTPFWGEFRAGHQRRTVPLRGLAFFRRRRGGRRPPPGCRPIPPDDAARRLMRVVMFFSDGLDDHGRLLATIRDLVTSVPVVELGFDTNRPFADVEEMLESARRRR